MPRTVSWVVRSPIGLKTLRWATGPALLLIASFPKEPCACVSAQTVTSLVVRGTVTKGSAPVSGAIVLAEGFFSESCASPRDVFVSNGFAATTSTAGAYTLRLASELAPRARCLRIVVRPSSMAGRDSVVVAGIRGSFRADYPPDTLTLDLAIP
jgi:hypothetical protein